MGLIRNYISFVIIDKWIFVVVFFVAGVKLFTFAAESTVFE